MALVTAATVYLIMIYTRKAVVHKNCKIIPNTLLLKVKVGNIWGSILLLPILTELQINLVKPVDIIIKLNENISFTLNQV